MFPETFAEFLTVPILYGLVQAVVLERLGWFQRMSSESRFRFNGVLMALIGVGVTLVTYFVPADALAGIEPYYAALRPFLLLILPAVSVGAGFVANWIGHALDKRFMPTAHKAASGPPYTR